jgi:hypothetical protein
MGSLRVDHSVPRGDGGKSERGDSSTVVRGASTGTGAVFLGDRLDGGLDGVWFLRIILASFTGSSDDKSWSGRD